jgi:sulfate transport system permease protein
VAETRTRTRTARARPGAGRLAMRLIVILYLSFLLVIPVSLIFWRTFSHGFAPVWHALQDPAMTSAFRVTAIVTGISVVIDTVFGVTISLLLVRYRFPGRRFLDAILDLPLAISPVVVGLALILVYGKYGWFGGFLERNGFQVIFALPGMVLATVFTSLPLVAREVMPVLEEIGTEQEQAARTLGAGPTQTFRRVTLPAIRWALAYGVVLSMARCLGEYGAVSVVSGRLVNKTQTLPLIVDQSFQNYDVTTAYTASFVLAAIAIASLVVISVLRPKERA